MIKLYHVELSIFEENIATEEVREMESPGSQIKTFTDFNEAYDYAEQLYHDLED